MPVPEWYLKILNVLTRVMGVGALFSALSAFQSAFIVSEQRAAAASLGVALMVLGVYLLYAEPLATKWATKLARHLEAVDERSRRLTVELQSTTNRKKDDIS